MERNYSFFTNHYPEDHVLVKTLEEIRREHAKRQPLLGSPSPETSEPPSYKSETTDISEMRVIVLEHGFAQRCAGCKKILVEAKNIFIGRHTALRALLGAMVSPVCCKRTRFVLATFDTEDDAIAAIRLLPRQQRQMIVGDFPPLIDGAIHI